MLLGSDGMLLCGLALHNLGQAAPVFIAVFIAALIVDFQKAIEQNHLSRRAQFNLTVCAGQIDARAFHPGGRHLAGQCALPNQIIKPALICVRNAQIVGCCGHLCGADTFMRFLRVLGFVFVKPRAGGHIAAAKTATNLCAGGLNRLGGHVDPVCPHVGYVPSFIKPLSCVHCGARTHAKFTAGLLLQC